MCFKRSEEQEMIVNLSSAKSAQQKELQGELKDVSVQIDQLNSYKQRLESNLKKLGGK
jgi:uncharacterized membrane-anchored protein YhcB (DUF1043 family)